MTKRAPPNRPQRLLTPDQVRELRAERAVYERLVAERAALRERVRLINAALPRLGYRALGRRYGISPRTVEAIATFAHYKEVR